MSEGVVSKNDMPILRKVDAVLVRVPSIQEGLDFYCERLGQALRWKKSNMAAVKLGDAELVLTTDLDPETDILVESVQFTVEVFVKAGGKILVKPEAIDVGMVAVVEDPFGNKITLVDLSKGLYQTDAKGNVTGVNK